MPKYQKPKIGVLALQGAFQLHQFHLEHLGAEYVEVVGPRDLDGIEGLILPGGESGVMLKLIEAVGIRQQLNEFLHRMPVWGICAGAILMAKVVSKPSQHSFGVLDIEIERNAYGRQLDSFQESINEYEVSFIRAPRITKSNENLFVLSKKNGNPTWVESDLSMVTTFHPETNLNFPSPWHQRFIGYCAWRAHSVAVFQGGF